MLRLNRYDYLIIIVITSLVFGTMQISIFGQHFFAAMLCFPLAAKELLIQFKMYKFKPVVLFMLVWLLYAVLSLIWTNDAKGGFGELFVFVCNAIIFLGLYHCAQYSIHPQKTFTIAWILLLLATFPIAFWEILTGNHLEKWGDFNEDYTLTDAEGYRIDRIFAAVTYKNLNSYVTLLVIALPIVLSGVISLKRKLIPLLVAICAMAIVLINASRGGLVCLCVILLVFLFHYSKVHFRYKKMFTLLVSVTIAVILIQYSSFIFTQIVGRLVGFQDNDGLLSDVGRWDVLYLGLKLCYESGGFGWGVGSMLEAYDTTGFWLEFAHNFVIEFLVQYGFWLFIPFALLLIKAFWRLAFGKNIALRAYGQMVALSFVPMSIIDDSYLAHPFVWAYLATLLALTDVSQNSRIEGCE